LFSTVETKIRQLNFLFVLTKHKFLGKISRLQRRKIEMTVSKISKLFQERRNGIWQLVQEHPKWIESKGFRDYWGSITRAQIKNLVNNNDCTIDLLVKLALKLNVSLGELLNLGVWSYCGQVNLGNKVKNCRDLAGMTKKEFAEKCGFSARYIHDLENNNTKGGFLLSTMEQLAEGCGLTLALLLSDP
jgi:DNA-binding XRE family transcriptional regulator